MKSSQQKQIEIQRIREVLQGSGDITVKSVEERVENCRQLQYEKQEQLFAVQYSTIHKAAADNSVSGIHYFIQHKGRNDGKTKGIDDYDKNGSCAIHLAAEKGCTDAIRCLLKLGSSVNAKSSYGNTPLMFACKENQVHAIKVLMEHGADAKLTNKAGFNCIHLAAQSDHVSAMEFIFDFLNSSKGAQSKSDPGKLTAIMQSTSTSSESSLPDMKFDSIRFEGESTISFSSSAVGITQNSSAVEILMNWKSFNGSTPLHLASMNQSFAAIELLLRYQATVDIADNSRETALHKAGKSGAHQAYRMLVKAGASEIIKNNLGETPHSILFDSTKF